MFDNDKILCQSSFAYMYLLFAPNLYNMIDGLPFSFCIFFYIILLETFALFLSASLSHPSCCVVWSSINNDLYPNTTLNQYQLTVKICLSLRADICLICLCTADSIVANGTHRKRSRLVLLNFFLGSCLKKSSSWKLQNY